MIFMETGGAVIEGFPSWHWNYFLYQGIAQQSGLFYRSFASEQTTSSWTSRSCLLDSACNQDTKREFKADVKKFEVALREAASLVGFLIE